MSIAAGQTSSLLPHVRARSAPETQPWLCATAATLAVVVVALAHARPHGSFLPAGTGAWLLLLAGVALVEATAIVASSWSQRRVLPIRTFPVLVGVVHFTAGTLSLVVLTGVLAASFALRPERPLRNIAQAGASAMVAVLAMMAFRVAAVPGDLAAPRTWAALVTAAALLALLDMATELALSAVPADGPTGSTWPIPVSIRTHDVLLLLTSAILGPAVVVAGQLHPTGVLFAVGGTVMVMALVLHHAVEALRRITDHHITMLQESLIAAVPSNTVVEVAAQVLRDPLQALAVGIMEPDGTHNVHHLGALRWTDEEGAMTPLVREVSTAADDRMMTAEELGGLATMLGVEGPCHLLTTRVRWTDDRIGLLYALRSGDPAIPWSGSDRALLRRAAVETGTAVASAQRLACLERRARYDELTGLPNRAHLEDTIGDTLARAAKDHVAAAVLLVDLNGFKEVNDTLGHQMGDDVLAQVGQRLAELGDRVDQVGRLGGDEFAIVMSAETPALLTAAAQDLADELSAAISRPITHGDLVLDLTVSIGLARFPEHGDSPEELLRAADVAMYAAKHRGVPYEVYEGRLDRHRTRRLGLATDLRVALAEEALAVFFQPKVRFDTGELIGAEALIRWSHPTLGFIPAGEIILIAEHAGLLRELTDFVLDRAAAHCATVRAEGFDLCVAVNLTERDIADPMLPERIVDAPEPHDLGADAISVEVTETALLTQETEALGVLPRVAELGIDLSIDDFGTGYSSLSHLRKFPVNEIKIDMSFVDRMVIRPNDAVIVRSIVELGHSLGMRVVAEGVETTEAWALLEEFGTDIAQGNHVMKAIDSASFVAWSIFWDQYREGRGRLQAGRPADRDELLVVQLQGSEGSKAPELG